MLYLSLFLFTAHMFLFPVPSSAQEEEQEYVCISCHLEMADVLKQAAVDWQESVHADAGVKCADCHGGDPYDYGMAMEPAAGFKGKPAKKDIPALCAQCHADRIKMRAYNKPSNQYSLYKGSVHGVALLENNNSLAPSCIDCHGGHRILRVADPESMVHRSNIVKTCAECHSHDKRMQGSGLPTNQYRLYKGSVHGVKYFEGDLGVPTCQDCHGNHGIQKSKTPAVKLVCATCHVVQNDFYRESPHWDAAQATGKPYCVDCHNNHDIKPPTPQMFVDKGENTCLECHSKNSLQMETALTLYKTIIHAEEDHNRADTVLSAITSHGGTGFETSHLEDKVAEIENIRKEMPTLAHSLNTDNLKSRAAKTEKLKAEVVEEVETMTAELNKRKWGLAATWIIFVTFSWALHARSNKCKRDE